MGLQFFEYSTLGFRPDQRRLRQRLLRLDVTYALGALWGVYWMETQIATSWRAKRTGSADFDVSLHRAGLSACSTVWTFYVAIGVIMFVVLYLI